MMRPFEGSKNLATVYPLIPRGATARTHFYLVARAATGSSFLAFKKVNTENKHMRSHYAVNKKSARRTGFTLRFFVLIWKNYSSFRHTTFNGETSSIAL